MQYNSAFSNSSWKWTVSKERLGPMITTTLKIRTWIIIDRPTSKELTSYADSKYIRFINFNNTLQKLRVSENSPYFKTGGNMSCKSESCWKLHCSIRFNTSENTTIVVLNSYPQKWGYFFFFCQKKDHGCTFICSFPFFLFFLRAIFYGDNLSLEGKS